MESKSILASAKNAIGKGVQRLSSKALKPYKNFFFTELRAGKEFQDCEKEIGEIHTVSIIITPKRTFMRSESETEKVDVDFTPEEKIRMLKTFKVKQSTVDACKSIFLTLDLKVQSIHIRQNKLDGSIKDMTI